MRLGPWNNFWLFPIHQDGGPLNRLSLTVTPATSATVSSASSLLSITNARKTDSEAPQDDQESVQIDPGQYSRGPDWVPFVDVPFISFIATFGK